MEIRFWRGLSSPLGRRLGLGLLLFGLAWAAAGLASRWKSPSVTDGIEWVAVERGDVETSLLAGGDLQPVRQTTVTCQVEDITDSEGTMILSVIPNGALVKKGDELCRLDSSQLDEMARLEEIAVGEARAAHLQARLVLETARIALREYQEGLVDQLTKEFEGRIALGQSDTERQADRVAWAEGMVAKGYYSEGQLLSERQVLARAQHELQKAEGEFQLFRRFQVPKEIRTLWGQVETAEINERLEADRKQVREDRLAYLRKQIANCTVRAPQDGVVVYANGSRWWSLPIQPGTPIYQDQVLFILPDLSQMEVEVSLHETVAPRVRLGMKADVHIASLADRALPGRVVAMNLLPIQDWKQWDEKLRHFVARIRLEKTPRSVLPFMSAFVRIDTGRIQDALVIPVESMAVVDGRQCCYVAAADGLECRTITTRRATPELLEVTGGLKEGERVVRRPEEALGIAADDASRETARDIARERSVSPGRLESAPRTS
jgi:HlyD family secretion protein